MKCRKCPFMMVCYGGSFIAGTYGLCLHCGRFFINMKKKPTLVLAQGTAPEDKYVTFLFTCEERPLLRDVVDACKLPGTRRDTGVSVDSIDLGMQAVTLPRKRHEDESPEDFQIYKLNWYWQQYTNVTHHVEDPRPQRTQPALTVSVCCECEYMHNPALPKPPNHATLRYIDENWIDLDATPHRSPGMIKLTTQ
jgi:hypothetical protein